MTAALQNNPALLKLNNACHIFHPMISPQETTQSPPLIISKGKGVFVEDVDGRTYLDAVGGLWNVNVGHGRDEVKQAIIDQLDQISYYTTFGKTSNPPQIELSVRLCEMLAREEMEKVLFSCSGSDAVETAFKLARQYHKLTGQPERTKFFSLKFGYHGVHFGGLSACGNPPFRLAFEPLLPGFFQVESPFLYRNPWTNDPEELARLCAEQLEREMLFQGPHTVAAVIAEPVQGADGVIVPPTTYWPLLRQICDRHGVLLIADEIVTGFGRTGEMFGCRLWDVKPDIMCFAKGITAAYVPLGATMVSSRIADAWMQAGKPAPIIRARYVVGCDGGRSGVRRAIGAQLAGTAVVQRVQSTYIKAPSLLSLTNLEPAWATFSLNPARCGNVYAIDGRENWLVHNYLKPAEQDFEAVDRDWALRAILGVGLDFSYDILSKEDWVGRRLVADKFRDRRIFICGDAAHLWVPMAGYGMNAGIADAANLAWLLAAHLNGWAPSSILTAHESERLPITEQVSHFAMNHALALTMQRGEVPANIDEDGSAGEQARAKLGRLAYDLNVQQYCCGGLNFGYFYDRSPIIAYDGESPPAYGMADFTPSTVPGCRTPHIWLDGGRSIYDAMGPGYTLLRFDPALDVTTFLAAARAKGVPLQLLDVAALDAATVYDRALVLSRPDQHVAWRGNVAPADAAGLVERIRGNAVAMQQRVE